MTGGGWYHCSLKPISRSTGRSAVACAAYRTGSCLEDRHYATIRDFSRKADVVTSFTLAPENAPAWATDVEQLWNAVEAKERRKDSQLAFEWETALPASLDDDQREALARKFAGWLVDEYGNAVTVGIHSGGNRGNGLNDHMHVMMTTRSIDEHGWGAKLRQFNTRAGAKNPEVEKVREQAALIINEALEDAGSGERVDHRSFKVRGLPYEGTTHLGPATNALERNGYATERGDINRAIIEARIVEQEALLPAITAELEREFAARFGDPERDGATPADSFDDLLAETRAGEPLPADIVEHAKAGREPMPEDVAASAQNPPAPPPGWWARLKRMAASFVEFFRDEGGGGPNPDPDRDRPEFLTKALSRGVETGRSFAERVREKGREIWGNQRGEVPIDPFEAMLGAMCSGELDGSDTPEPDSPDRDAYDRDGPDLD